MTPDGMRFIRSTQFKRSYKKAFLSDLGVLSECNERAREKACVSRKGAKNAKKSANGQRKKKMFVTQVRAFLGDLGVAIPWRLE